MEYAWYQISPFATSVMDKYDETKDNDLQMLCNVIPDFVFVVFKRESSGTSMFLRIPSEYTHNVDSISSFGTKLLEFPRYAKIESLTELRFRKKSVFPLVYDKKEIHHDLFSMMSSAPYGVFCIKLLHAKSDIIKKQFDRNHKKFENKKDVPDTNFYERMLKSKSEQSVFFYTDMFFGCAISDVVAFRSIIPFTGDDLEPNSLVKKKVTSQKQQNTEKATDLLRKKLLAASKKTQMILSGVDILPFVCFSKHVEYQQMKSAQNKLHSNSYSTIHDVDDPQTRFESGDTT